ncbi:hypothetical protein [Piscirickettsia salmonis]|uniref:hypothetical protein n=1 Tax=Piscirickettsia salmonis TaxID=1238 RepID=UPI0007C88CC8
MLGDFASLDVQNTYRGSDAYVGLIVPGLFVGMAHKKMENIRFLMEIFILQGVLMDKCLKVWAVHITPVVLYMWLI